MPSLPKIVLLGKLPPPAFGPAIATQILLNSGLKEQFQIIHVSTKLNEELASFNKFSLTKPFKLLAIYWQLIISIVAHRPKLIIIPFSQTTSGFLKDSPFILISWLLGRKVLLQLRGSDFLNWVNQSPAWVKVWVRMHLKMTSGMVVLGNNLRYLFKDYYTDDRIFSVPNGANYPLPERGSEGSKVQVLYLANFLPTKGFKELLTGLIKLKHIYGQFRLTAVGNWDNEEYKAICHEIVKTNNLPVDFYPPKAGKEKMQAFADADVFIFTPKAPEGHPWVLVESLASGLPVISTDQGAIVESVIHGENGFIVKPENPRSIAEALEKLISNRGLREKMANASREHYSEHFTEEVMVENYTRVINTLINS